MYVKKMYVPLTPFVLIKINEIRIWYQNLCQLLKNELFYTLIPLIKENYPHILRKPRLKTGLAVCCNRIKTFFTVSIEYFTLIMHIFPFKVSMDIQRGSGYFHVSPDKTGVVSLEYSEKNKQLQVRGK